MQKIMISIIHHHVEYHLYKQIMQQKMNKTHLQIWNNFTYNVVIYHRIELIVMNNLILKLK